MRCDIFFKTLRLDKLLPSKKHLANDEAIRATQAPPLLQETKIARRTLLHEQKIAASGGARACTSDHDEDLTKKRYTEPTTLLGTGLCHCHDLPASGLQHWQQKIRGSHERTLPDQAGRCFRAKVRSHLASRKVPIQSLQSSERT
jgi:hypothetical protein